MSSGRGRYGHQPSTCIYVGNLPDDVREDEIERIFEKFGELRKITVKRDHIKNGPAHAFVDFVSLRDAEDAVDRDGDRMIGRNRLRVEFSDDRWMRRKREGISRGPPQRTEHRVVVFGLPNNCPWQSLKDHMRSAGDVGYANVEMGKGIVEYTSVKGLETALETLDESELKTYNVSVTIKVRRDDGSNEEVNGVHRRRRSRSRSNQRNHYRDRGSYRGYSSRHHSPPSSRRHRDDSSEPRERHRSYKRPKSEEVTRSPHQDDAPNEKSNRVEDFDNHEDRQPLQQN